MLNFFETASSTHVGEARQDSPNQDSIKIIRSGLFHRRLPLLIIADGMGGHTGGALASKIVVDTFEKSYLKNYSKLSPVEILEESVRDAHQAIRMAGQKDQHLSTMGSTVVAAILSDSQLHLINVGDSRLYLFRERKIQQISFDQSIVAEKVRRGEITEEEAYNHPQKNQLTMSINAHRDTVTPYCAEQSLETNDVILLCSDGLWGSVPTNLIRAVACQLKPKIAVKKLIGLANESGGPDNISVIIARQRGSILETGDEEEEDNNSPEI
jgi:PPM family protein phosphatase